MPIKKTERNNPMPISRARAIAASIGIKKYGAKKFQAMATAGKRRAAARKRLAPKR